MVKRFYSDLVRNERKKRGGDPGGIADEERGSKSLKIKNGLPSLMLATPGCWA